MCELFYHPFASIPYKCLEGFAEAVLFLPLRGIVRMNELYYARTQKAAFLRPSVMRIVQILAVRQND